MTRLPGSYRHASSASGVSTSKALPSRVVHSLLWLLIAQPAFSESDQLLVQPHHRVVVVVVVNIPPPTHNEYRGCYIQYLHS